MLSNYFKVAWRNLVKFKGHSLINIVGLAIGIALCILTYLFVQYEHSFDYFHKNGERIYLAGVQRSASGGRRPSASTPPILAETLKENIPEIEYIARVFGWDIKDGTPVRCGEKAIRKNSSHFLLPFSKKAASVNVISAAQSILYDLFRSRNFT